MKKDRKSQPIGATNGHARGDIPADGDDLTQGHLVTQSYKRLLIATELLAQATAVESFREQGLLDKPLADDEIVRLVSAFSRETNDILKLLDHFLQNGNQTGSQNRAK